LFIKSADAILESGALMRTMVLSLPSKRSGVAVYYYILLPETRNRRWRATGNGRI